MKEYTMSCDCDNPDASLCSNDIAKDECRCLCHTWEWEGDKPPELKPIRGARLFATMARRELAEQDKMIKGIVKNA